MQLLVERDADRLADRAATLFRGRVRAAPELAMAVPAGRTPRRMYARMAAWQIHDPVDFSRMHVFSVDELCPPAPSDGYFWRQVRGEFLAWAGASAGRLRPFTVDAPDLAAMCTAYERAIAQRGGLDLVMLGLGPNGHIASNEPGTPFDAPTRLVRLLPETVAYILTDAIIRGPVCEHAVTLGTATIAAAREVIVLVSGRAKQPALGAMVHGPVTPEVPASMLRHHPCCTVLADRDAAP